MTQNKLLPISEKSYDVDGYEVVYRHQGRNGGVLRGYLELFKFSVDSEANETLFVLNTLGSSLSPIAAVYLNRVELTSLVKDLTQLLEE